MTDTTAACLVIALLSNIIGISVSAEFAQNCSPLCLCDIWYELPRASCTGRHLYNVDTGAPSNVQALDLSDNVVSSLNNFELAVSMFRLNVNIPSSYQCFPTNVHFENCFILSNEMFVFV